MVKSELKKKLKQRIKTVGSWITIGNEIIAEIMAKAGFDWLVIDMEHSAITLPQAQNMVRIIDLCGGAPLIRVSENNANEIKRAMDTGAHGVIVPMVNTAEEARRAVAAVRYPPKGKRGVGLARAQRHGLDFSGYQKWVASESVVIVQIEHKDAIPNLDQILNVEGVDGFLIGPYDISGSVGHPGNFSHPDVKKCLDTAIQCAKRRKAVAGIHVIAPDPNEVKLRLKEGYQFVAFSLDALIFSRKIENAVALIKKIKDQPNG